MVKYHTSCFTFCIFCIALLLFLGVFALPITAVEIQVGEDGKLLPLDNGFPSGPITIWNAHPPGHTDEIEARLFAREAEKYSPVPLVARSMSAGPAIHFGGLPILEDTPGGTEGYHVFTGSITGLATRLLTQDTLGRTIDDLVDMSILVTTQFGPLMVCRPDAVWGDNIGEMVEWAKDNPGRLRYSASAVGSFFFLTGATLAENAGYDYVPIPANGHLESVNLVLGGGAEIAITNTAVARPLVNEGRLVVLAQMSEERSSSWPDIPSMYELGYGGPPIRIGGIITHPDVPEAEKKWLAELFSRAARGEDYQKYLQDAGQDSVDYRGNEAANQVRNLYERLKPVIYNLGLEYEG